MHFLIYFLIHIPDFFEKVERRRSIPFHWWSIHLSEILTQTKKSIFRQIDDGSG
jgi:hypothetical protein